ncbi:unnamed protein product [Withania somnifera]
MGRTSFSIKKVYVLMGDDLPRVNWRRLNTCNNLGSIKERLLTRDRLMQWGAIESARCLLYDQEDESHNHLFFLCSYSATVWSKMLQWQGIQRRASAWQEEKQWVTTHTKGQNVQAKIYQMCLAGVVYHIWRERNTRVLRQIIQDIHVRGSMKIKLAKKLDTMNFYP